MIKIGNIVWFTMIGLIVLMFATIIIKGDSAICYRGEGWVWNNMRSQLGCELIQQQYQCCKQWEYPWHNCADNMHNLYNMYNCTFEMIR